MSRDKAGKFIELATKRVNRAIKDLKLVANLANKQNYEYSNDQAKKIVKALQQEIELVKQSFHTGENDSQSTFSL